MRERDRDRKCLCMFERERKCLYVGGEREAHKMFMGVCVIEKERHNVCVCV